MGAVTGRRVRYSVGFDLDERARTAIGQVPELAWQHVLDHHGSPRDPDNAGIVDLTGLLRESVAGDTLKGWPAGMANGAAVVFVHPTNDLLTD